MRPPGEEALKQLVSDDGYRRYFMDVGFWRPWVEYVCRRDEIVDGDIRIRIGLKGTYPTFIVNDEWVLKFFGQNYDGHAAHRAEWVANQLLTGARVPAPAMVRSGAMLPDATDWQWPFLQMEFVPGSNIGKHFAVLSRNNKHELASWIAETARSIHQAPAVRTASESTQQLRAAYVALIQQNHTAVLHGRELPPGVAALPTHLQGQAAEYLLPLAELLAPPRLDALVHADLTADHILGRYRQGSWQPEHVIDFGDAMIGDWHYDLGALHLDLFRADRTLLRAFVDAYGLDAETQRALPRRAMSLTLLHRYDLFESLTASEIDWSAVPTLAELERRLWDCG